MVEQVDKTCKTLGSPGSLGRGGLGEGKHSGSRGVWSRAPPDHTLCVPTTGMRTWSLSSGTCFVPCPYCPVGLTLRCLTLCDPIDSSSPGSAIPGILQARTLECKSCLLLLLLGRFSRVRLTLWDPIDGSPPGSPVPGILQARTLEWVAISFSNA